MSSPWGGQIDFGEGTGGQIGFWEGMGRSNLFRCEYGEGQLVSEIGPRKAHEGQVVV